MTSAIKTAGTTSTTALKALRWLPQSETAGVGATGWTTDLAAMNAYITQQASATSSYGSKKIFDIPRVVPGGVYYTGRGLLLVRSGDWVVVDPNSGAVTVLPDTVFTQGTPTYVHS